MTRLVAEYGATSDGLMAARIDYLGFIAIPVAEGFRLATSLSTSRPITAWRKEDAFGSAGLVADVAGFRAHVEDCLLHLRQRAALGRVNVDLPMCTPWGPSQSATQYAEGIVCHETASHGGFHLSPERNTAMHPALRIAEGWYEEDGDWALVATGYPELFTDQERRSAETTLRDWMPDAWEAVHGRKLHRFESFTRDREAFERDHAGDWIVIAATMSQTYPGDVVAVATLGGRRAGARARSFLVPDAEYAIGRHGFVIDPVRHTAID